jgi:cellobiose-specific phosphotransferase system component IIC
MLLDLSVFFWFAGIKGASASQGIWTGLFTYSEIAKAKYLASTGGPFLGATAWKYGCRSLQKHGRMPLRINVKPGSKA